MENEDSGAWTGPLVVNQFAKCNFQFFPGFSDALKVFGPFPLAVSMLFRGWRQSELPRVSD